jgi:hypothetical protein
VATKPVSTALTLSASQFNSRASNVRRQERFSYSARGYHEHEPTRVSDADLRVVMHEAQTWEPLDEIEASRHVVLRTDRPLAEIISDPTALLDQRVGPGFR